MCRLCVQDDVYQATVGGRQNKWRQQDHWKPNWGKKQPESDISDALNKEFDFEKDAAERAGRDPVNEEWDPILPS